MLLFIALSLVGSLVQSAAAPSIAAVSGQVVEEGSGRPVEGAQVTITPSRSGPGDRSRSTITDHEGRYVFDNLEAGQYWVMVQKPGFVLLTLTGPPPMFDLEPGERRDGVTVTLQKSAVIVGRVLDEHGEPLIDARVEAMQRPPVPGAGLRLPHGLVHAGRSAQTNDLGEFRLFGLPPGEYYVMATPSHGLGMSPPPRATTMLPTYFPTTPDPVAAQPINVAGGQTSADIVIRMVGVPAFQVSGVVLDEGGRPIVNAMVRLIGEEPATAPMFMMGRLDQQRTDTSGKFTLNNVPNGTYTLLAVAPVVISGPADGRRGTVGVTGGGSAAFAGRLVGGSISGGVTTEITDGTTTEYRDDTGTRMPVTVNQANVSGLEIIVRRLAR
jgi:protocatechuate 3,4-dioxygenase beta subunit